MLFFGGSKNIQYFSPAPEPVPLVATLLEQRHDVFAGVFILLFINHLLWNLEVTIGFGLNNPPIFQRRFWIAPSVSFSGGMQDGRTASSGDAFSNACRSS